MRIQAWEIRLVHPVMSRDKDSGERTDRWEAVLYTEPLWRHVVGELLEKLWWKLPNWALQGGSFRERPDGTVKFPWQLRLELWVSYGFRHNKRHYQHVERVRVADRDPDTWHIAPHLPKARI